MADINGITATSVYVEALGINHVEATLNGVAEEDLLENIDAQVAVEHYGDNTLLDLIGKQAAIDYFKITAEDL